MKILILILSLFVSSLTFSQDGYNLTPEHYQKVKDYITNLSLLETRELSNIIVGSTESEFVYYRQIFKPNNGVVYVYVLNSQFVERYYIPHESIVITYLEGYNLFKIQGQFKDLFQIWLQIFIQDISQEQVLENFRYRDFVFEPIGIDFRLSERNKIWTIRQSTKKEHLKSKH